MNCRVLILLFLGLVAVSLFLVRRGKVGASVPEFASVAPAEVSQPKLATHRFAFATQQADEDTVGQESRIKKLLRGEELPLLSVAELEGYLAANHRNVGSLLAAFRASGDRELLREAVEKFPNDGRVAAESWFRSKDEAERAKWLETWERAEPNNSMASYLAAANLFKMGNADGALQKLEAALTKPDFSFHELETIQDMEEAYKGAGYSEAESKMVSTWGLLLPQLAEMKGMAQMLGDLSSAYRESGDESSADAVLQMGLQMGQRMTTSRNSAIDDLVGIAVDNIVLKKMDPAAPSGFQGKTVQELLAVLAAQRAEIKAWSHELNAEFLQQVSEPDLAAYCDRLKIVGEREAIRWLAEKYGKKP